MRRFIPILIWFYCSQAAPVGEAEDALSIRGHEELTLCMTEYTRLTGGPIADEIDRVYIHVFNDLDGILFTEGAVGTFGKRSPTYASWLGCTVKNGEMVHLELTMRTTLFKTLDYNIFEGYEEYHEGTVIELLYLRVNGRFEFCCSQPFDVNNIDKHNPDRKQQILDALNGESKKEFGPGCD